MNKNKKFNIKIEIKKNQTEMLELKKSVNEMKNPSTADLIEQKKESVTMKTRTKKKECRKPM